VASVDRREKGTDHVKRDVDGACAGSACAIRSRTPAEGASAPLLEPRVRRVHGVSRAPLRKAEWVVRSKRPFAEPAAVLAYLARCTHRVAIADSRLIALRDGAVTFKWKDYRVEGRDRQETMTLSVAEFIRRSLIHVLPSGFHCIRHYGLLASGARAHNIAGVRQLLTPAAQPLCPSAIPSGSARSAKSSSPRCGNFPLLPLATGDLSAFLDATRIRGWMGRADQTTKVKGMFVHPS
jgi:hypothetical protein